MTKREVLIEICENPGWEPPNQGNGTERFLDELKAEGWIQPSLSGFHATTKAMDGYPYFIEQADIAEERPHVEHRCVPMDRVVALVRRLLVEMPVGQVFALATMPERGEGSRGPELEIARRIVERMTDDTPF